MYNLGTKCHKYLFILWICRNSAKIAYKMKVVTVE